MTRKQKKNLVKIVISVVLTAVGLFLPDYPIPRMILALVAFLVVGSEVLVKAFHGVVRGQVFDENFLMSAASVGAFLCGDYTEAVAVLIFYAVGELFESYALDKSRKSIASLLDITADTARVEGAEGLVEIPAEEVAVGTVITLLPGDKIPIDSIILEGETQLMTSALTGESKPKTARAGDEVLSGCINMTAKVQVRTTKAFSDSAASKVLELIELSAAKKSRSEKFITKFAKIYTPTVCLSALLLAVMPPVVSLAVGNSPMWIEWIKRALTFLVISCPCALVVSVPMSFFGGISAVSKSGILVKGSNYLEALSQVSQIAFDKTGTLTEGSFEVTDIFPVGCDREKLMTLASAAECYSTHPIAVSILKEAGIKADRDKISHSENLSGKGVTCLYGGQTVSAGNALLMEEIGVAIPEMETQGTAVYVACDGQYMGCIAISDRLKDTSKITVESLKKSKISTFMLTGDKKEVAQAVGESLGIDRVYPELLPGDKLSVLEEVMRSGKGTTAFVGDGINDAPVLMRSDVGIAMGALGSDAAVEAADIVIMDDDPKKILTAIRHSKKTVGIVRQNIAFSLAVKFIFLLLGAVGVSNMWLSIFADVGVLIIAVLNAMRCMRVN